MLLHLLELLLLLTSEFEPTTLHQDELGEELSLFQQKIEFLTASHFLLRGHRCWTASPFSNRRVATRARLLARRFTAISACACSRAALCEHLCELLSLLEAVIEGRTLLLFLLLNCLAKRCRLL